MAMEHHILQMVGFSLCHLSFCGFFHLICRDYLVEVVLRFQSIRVRELTASSEIVLAKVQYDIMCHLSRNQLN